MKKLIFTLALALGVFASSSAQEPGQMWLGGSVGMWSSKLDVAGQDSKFSYKVLPEFGYVVSENIGVGINVGFEHEEGYDENSATLVDVEREGFTVAPFVRYSFLKGDIGAMFIDGGVGYTFLKDKKAKEEGHTLEVGLRPGVALKVSEKIVLTGKFGFIGYQNDKWEDVKANSFGLNLDMKNILIGASFVF